MKHLSRRSLLRGAAGSGAFLCLSGLLPLWAQSAARGNWGVPSGTANSFNLDIDRFPVRIDGRSTTAVGINGTLPGPLIRFREGDDITLNVTNRLAQDTSIHWHGLLVPFHMDGVPGVSFPGIKPGETFSYRFAVPQSGTYWYHSHSGMQEQLGHYGPIIIDPKDADPVQYDREYVLILGDWTFEDPHRIFAKLKKNAESLNFQRRTAGDLVDDISENGLSDTIADRAMWGRMRMSSTDWADVTGATYTYVINGHSTADNWNGVFRPGERVRLRIINAAAMSIFNFRIPGLPMTVVASDGLNVQPLETDEFQIGVAETYDVIVEPREEKAYAMVAESIDRSGQVVATLGPRPGMRAEEPKIRKPVPLTMKDMGMDHSAMSGMDHSKMDHAAMGHGTMTTQGDAYHTLPTTGANIQRGPGVVNIAAAPANRLDEPGHGLTDVPHRALRYAQLRSLDVNPDLRQPEREIELHLTSNMERYMWSFDGKRYSEVEKPIVLYEGERLRLTMVNDTMMPHPIHLHGMFFDVVNGADDHKPRKHTIIVKPGEKLSVDISAEHVGDWAFHCHLLYHMEAGMFQVVSVLPKSQTPPHTRRHQGNSEPGQGMKKEVDHKHMHHGHGDKAESETGGRK
ncbi:copper resistance system multicopper oxidase [Kordiimonas sp.]|uniref:copper resistance system multicopper oxidase n=1 Tax=Kordiimonas sp. TaxID=1970157 RepID=UPI003A9406F6